MNPIIRNFLAVLAGVVVGNLVNMGIITLSSFIIPLPVGADMATEEGFATAIQLFEPKHFIFPFLAHALGTFTGAFIGAFFAAHRHLYMALGVSVFFLIGGIAMVYMYPAPYWFVVLDLILAYIPMGYLGWIFAIRNKNKML